MAEIPTVKTLTNILRRIAALPQKQHPERKFRELTQRPATKDAPAEKDSDYRVRALAVIGSWWGRSGDTVRSMQDGHRHGKDSPGFLRDLQQYGGCQFDEETGELDPSSLGKGPDPMTYILSLPTRKRPPARRKKKPIRRSARA